MANCEHNINLNNPFRVNIELRYGNTVDGIRLVFFTDEQETPMDFTGWTFSTDFFDIEVELPNVLILSKSAEGMEVTLRDYNLDIKGTLNGVEKTIVAGKYEVKKDYLTSGCVQDGSTINLQYFNVIERIVIEGGWLPYFAVVNNGIGKTMQLAGWFGGEGDEPTQYIGWYIGEDGYVEDIVEAVIFGEKGDTGKQVEIGNNGTAIVWRYVGDAAWIPIVPLEDLSFKYSDFTPEQILLLQQPALDAADIANEATLNANNAADDAKGATPEPAPSFNLGAPATAKTYYGGPGNYTLAGVATNYPADLNIFFWDKTDWSVLQIPIVVPNKIPDWLPQAYNSGLQVNHEGQWYQAMVNTLSTDVPGAAAETIWKPIIDKITTDDFTMHIGKNRYDKSYTVDDGKYILNGGGLGVNPLYTTSDFIDVSDLPDNADMFASPAPGVRRHAFYDASKVYMTGSMVDLSTQNITKITGAAYIRISLLQTNQNTFQLEVGDHATAYENYIPRSIKKIKGIPIANADKDPFDKSETYNRQTIDGKIPAVVFDDVPASKNLFNKDVPEANKGMVLDSEDGTLIVGSTYDTSDFIDVSAYPEGQVFSALNEITGRGARRRGWYTSNNESSNIPGSSTEPESQTETKPAGANFLRISVLKTSLDSFQLEAGDPTPYVPYSPAHKLLISVAGAILPEIPDTPVETLFDANVAMPKKLYALVGQEFNLYYDSFNIMPEYGAGVPSFLFDVVNSKAQVRYRSLQFTPVPGDVGVYALTFRFLNNSGDILQTVTTDLEVVARTPFSSAKNILIIGDSTWHNGGTGGATATKTLYEILDSVGGAKPVFFGLQQPAPWKNEARTNKTWSYFANGGNCHKIYFSGVDPSLDLSNLRSISYYHGSSGNSVKACERWVVNPDGTGWFVGYNSTGVGFTPPSSFPATLTRVGTGEGDFPATLTVTNAEVINFSIFKDNNGQGELNIDYYVETVLNKPVGTKIDVFLADLGINDTTSPGANIEGIISNAKKLIGAFKAHNPAIKVILCYPKNKGSDYFYTTRRGIRFTMQKLRKALIDTFDDNPDYPNVYISQSAMGMDRFYAYQIIDTALSGTRYTDPKFQFKATNNDVHPNDEGNKQIADAVSGCLVNVLNS